MEREEGETTSDEKQNNNKEQEEVNNLDDVDEEVEACDRVIAVGDQEELEELEQSLQALERLDRSSPDLWPDQVENEQKCIQIDQKLTGLISLSLYCKVLHSVRHASMDSLKTRVGAHTQNPHGC